MYCEAKSRLSIAHIVLTVSPEWNSQTVQFTAERELLTFTVDEQNPVDSLPCSREVHVKLEGLRFLPPSCSGLKWETKNELHLRLQLDEKYGLAENEKMLSSSQLEEKMLQRFKQPDFVARCTFCQEALIQDTKFERVLPLPSDNFFEMPETLFCHQSPTDTKHQISRTNLLPRNKDCFVAPAYFLVTLGACNPGAFVVTESSVKCSRCDCKLGSVLRGQGHEDVVEKAIQLSTFLVSLNNSEPTCIMSDIAKMLMGFRNLYNCCRFIIETADSGPKPRPFMLVWLLEVNTSIYQLSVKQLLSKYEHEIEQTKCMKILYQDCDRAKDTSMCEAWQRDLTIHSLVLPHSVCLKLMEKLIDSTCALPPSLRVINDLYVGFFPLPS